MAEAPEIPEANDPFEKRAAVTIAILAVVLAVVGNKGDNAKTDSIIKTNKASNQWGYYQAKGIKGSIASAQEELLASLAPTSLDTKSLGQPSADIQKKIAGLKADAERYKSEQEPIKKDAEESEKDAEVGSKINDRCDLGSLALQIAIVIASVSILARSQAFWVASIILGLIGIGIGVSAFLL